jgi:DNA-binding response OmpR family regulator
MRIELSPAEGRIRRVLCRHAGEVLSTEDILEAERSGHTSACAHWTGGQ